MKKKRTTKNKGKLYKSDAFAAIHETAIGMYDAGVIDKKTMRRFDRACLTPMRVFTGAEILSRSGLCASAKT